jgi:hypothetical protein
VVFAKVQESKFHLYSHKKNAMFQNANSQRDNELVGQDASVFDTNNVRFLIGLAEVKIVIDVAILTSVICD